MNFESMYGSDTHHWQWYLKTWEKNPTDQNAKIAFITMDEENAEVPPALREQVVNILSKQVADYALKRPGKRTPAFDKVVHYTRYLLIEGILQDSDNKEKTFQELGGDSFKRKFMKWRRKYKNW